MPEDPTNQRQPHATARANTGEGMPEVVNVDVFDPGKFADAEPFLVQAVEVSIASRGWKNPRLVTIHPASLFLENLNSNSREWDDLGSGFAGLLAQHAKVEIDLRPFQPFDLSAAGAGHPLIGSTVMCRIVFESWFRGMQQSYSTATACGDWFQQGPAGKLIISGFADPGFDQLNVVGLPASG